MVQNKLSTFTVTAKNSLNKFWQDEEGATAAEYGIIAALIALAIISAVTLLGSKIKGSFSAIANGMPQAAG